MNVECKSTIFKIDDKGKYNDITNEFLKEFTLENIQFGDIITLRNGGRYVYADRCIYGENDNYELDCEILSENYNSSLRLKAEFIDETFSIKKENYDIVKVERQGQIIYERKEEVVEMTLSEICEKLGYNVKIVKEKSEE